MNNTHRSNEMERETTAWKEATREGMRFFWAHMHAGHTVQFVGAEWEEGGFHVNAEGNPVSDVKGNTVAKYSVEDLDEENNEHRFQVEEWWG
jgi:hypothetical protein